MTDAVSKLSVAPMMDWTNRHCRAFHSILAPKALLYTEMIIAQAILRGNRRRLLANDGVTADCALQLGGSEPKILAEAANIGESWGYQEINLNVGCPSDRVQKGRVGACLMLEPETVAACVAAIKSSVKVRVTVKCRIGVDDNDSEDFLLAFASHCEAVGVDGLIVHARKAILQGLSPKQNREIPPLNYARVRWLKAQLPALPIVVNGGIQSSALYADMAANFDGVMVGRAAYQLPLVLAEIARVDSAMAKGIGEKRPTAGLSLAEARDILNAYLPYVEAELSRGLALRHMTRHILGLFKGMPGGRRWRQVLSEEAVKDGAGLEVIEKALPEMDALATMNSKQDLAPAESQRPEKTSTEGDTQR